MMPALADVRALVEGGVFKVTRALVRTSASRGGYTLEVVGPVIEALEDLEKEESLGEIIEVGGVAHSPNWDQSFACRLDDTGLHPAANANADAVIDLLPLVRKALVGA